MVIPVKKMKVIFDHLLNSLMCQLTSQIYLTFMIISGTEPLSEK